MPHSAVVHKFNAQFRRARIAKWDFEEAAEYLRALRGRRLNVLRRALITSAIVAYCRPFTQNEVRGAAKATPQLAVSLKALYDTDEMALHDKLLALRHEALAHSAYLRKPVGRISGNSRGFHVAGRPFDILAETVSYDMLMEMCAKLEAHCENKMFELNRDIVRVESAA